MPIFLNFKSEEKIDLSFKKLRQLKYKDDELSNLSSLLTYVKMNVEYPDSWILILKSVFTNHDKIMDLFADGVLETNCHDRIFLDFTSRKGWYNYTQFKEMNRLVENVQSIFPTIEYIEGEYLKKSTGFKRRIREPFTIGTCIGRNFSIAFAWFVGNIRISDIRTFHLNVGDVFVLGNVSNGSSLCGNGLCVKYSIIL